MNNQDIWNRLIQDERNSLLRLLLRSKRIEAIKYVRAVGDLSLIEARDFVDSAWLCQQIVYYDPTRMTVLEEFKAEILRVLADMKEWMNHKDMSVEEKYQFITDNHIPMLFSLCTED